ncbi:MAG TPA: hypothetical protein PLW02_03070 [Verrucomicrobiota bacterium]|nr:hypothetical protein [Verrucomicrobiota bacterium]
MSAISEIIVREYFEIHNFLVRQQRKHIPRTEKEDEEVDFIVYNPEPTGTIEKLPVILDSEKLKAVSCAIVSVKGWHTDIVSPSIVKKITSDLEQFVKKDCQKYCANLSATPLKIVVLPSITTNREQRLKTLELLYNAGVDAVLQFRTILWDLVNYVQVNRNYSKSDVLQVIRILKAYDFFKEPQMMLFGRRRRTVKSISPTKNDTTGNAK